VEKKTLTQDHHWLKQVSLVIDRQTSETPTNPVKVRNFKDYLKYIEICNSGGKNGTHFELNGF
jgi:hypothetical protein